MKRFLSLLMCLLLVVSCLVLSACTTDEGGPDGPNGPGDKDFLNEQKNFNGQKIKILGYGGETSLSACQIDIEEGSDDPVKDAFYRRNQLIKDTYGLDIDVVLPGTGENPVNMIKTDIATNQKKYQAICNVFNNIAPLAIDGYFQDVAAVNNEYLHLNEAWWDQTILKDLKINNKVFFVNGDALVEDDEATWAIYFNKDLIEEYNLESPYDLVADNEWTIDKMYEMAKKVGYSSGATKSYDPAVGDVWGMVVQSYDYFQMMLGADQPMINNDGTKPVLRVDDEENILTFNQIKNLFDDRVNVGCADFEMGDKDYETRYGAERQIFANGNALFMPGSISYVSLKELQESNIHYGILPMPKRGALQENYSSGTNSYYCAVIAIPRTNKDETLAATCYALEAMAYYGKTIVTPEYYDRTLTLKKFEDTESGEMLDIIFNNRVYDIANIYNLNSGNPSQGTMYFYTNLISKDGTGEIVSSYNEHKQSFEKGLANLLERCAANAK